MLPSVLGSKMAKNKSHQVSGPIEYVMDHLKIQKKVEHESSNLNFTEQLIKNIEDERSDGFEDGRVTKALFKRMQVIELGCLVMSLFGIILTIIQYELEFYETHDKWSMVLLYLIFVVSIALVILTITRYLSHVEFLKMRNVISSNDTIWTTGEYIPMICESCLALVIPYPWIRGEITEAHALDDGSRFYYHPNEILAYFSTLRVVIVLRVVLLSAYWNSNRAQRLCEMYAVEPGALFTIKCWMKKNPYIFVFAGFLGSIPFFAWMLRIAERPLTRIDGDALGFDYANSMWHIIVTMTTVGYGDFFARTFLGRGIIFFVCIWGTMIISMMVVTLTNIFQMNIFEMKAFTILERLKAKESVRTEAAYVLTNIIRGKKISKQKGELSEKHLDNAKRHLKKFKSASRNYRELSDQNTGMDDVMRNFEFLREQVVAVMKRQDFICGALKEVMPTLGIDLKAVEALAKRNNESMLSKKSKQNAKDLGATDRDGKIELLLTEAIPEEEEIIINEEIGGNTKKQIPFYESVNESPEDVRLVE